jgi:hypothetical protein
MTELNRTALEAAHAAAMYEIGSHIHEGAISAAIRAYVAAIPQPQAGEAVACVIAFREGKREPELLSWNVLPVGEHPLYASPQPANPAQVPDAMVEAAVTAYNTCWPGGLANREQMRAAITAAIGAGGQAVAVKPLDNDQIMEIIKEAAPWKSEPDLNDLLTYEKSPPLFPQATYDVPSYRAVNFVRAVEHRILSALSQPHPANERVVEALAEIQAIAMLAEGNATLSAIGRIARAALSAAPATADGWRDMSEAPKDGTRILLAWKPVSGLSEHVELGKWKDRQGWSNTYGHAFSGDPDAWARLAPFALLAAPTADGWRDMSSVPKDGTKVDLWCRAPGLSAGQARVTDCWFSVGKWWRYDEHGDDQCRSRVHNATHWRPLPAAPTATGGR